MEARNRRDRRNATIRASIAVLAVFGIGAAITTAAWTDDVWFTADGTVASFNLQGSSDGGNTWEEAATADAALVIPFDAAEIGALAPNNTYTADVLVKNAGSTTAVLDTPATAVAPALTTATVAATAAAAEATLEPGDTTTVTVTVTTGNIPDSSQGATGTILVTVSGQSVEG